MTMVCQRKFADDRRVCQSSRRRRWRPERWWHRGCHVVRPQGEPPTNQTESGWHGTNSELRHDDDLWRSRFASLES